MTLNIFICLTPLVIVTINAPLVCGLITVYKTDRAPNSPFLVKSILENESVWIHKTFAPGKAAQHVTYGTMDKVSI